MVSDLTPIYQAAGREWNVDPALLQAIAAQESGGAPNPDQAVSPKGASGRMQLMSGTAQDIGVTDTTDPVQNIYGGAKYMSGLLDRYRSPELALAAYNAGPGRVDAYLAGKGALPAETLAYVPGVTKHYQTIAAPAAAPQAPADDPFTAALKSAGQPDAPAAPSDPFSQSLAAAQKAATPAPAAAASSTPAVTPAEPQAPPTALQSVEAGLNRFGHDVLDLPAEGLSGAATYVANKLGYPTVFGAPTGQQVTAADNQARQNFDQTYGRNPLAQGTRLAGDVLSTVAPVGTIGRAVEAGGQAALGSGLLARGATSALSGAAQGIAGAGLTAGSSDSPLVNQLAGGAAIGGALAPLAGVAGRVAGGVRNALVGGNTPADVAQLARTATDQYGVPIYAGQLSTSPATRFLDSVTRRLPLSGAEGAMDVQQKAFNNAVASTFGENADRITPQVMSTAKARLGSVFDKIASQSNVNADDQFINDLGQIETDATSTLPDAEFAPIKRQLDNVLGMATKGDGVISGDSYQALTRKGAPLDRAMQSSDPNVKFYASQIRGALDDALQRSAPQEVQTQLQQARSQYKAMKTIEDLVEKSTTGDISPALLMGRVRQSYGNMAYGGGGPLGDLARIGQQFLKEAPSSGTAERMMTIGALGGLGPEAVHNPITAGLSAAGSIAGGRLLGAVLRSQPYANLMIRNSLRTQPGVISRTGANLLRLVPNTGVIARQNLLSGPVPAQ